MVSAPRRFSLKILMALIAVIALGLGLMRNGSAIALRLTLVATLIAMLVALLGAFVRRGEGTWVGFALFGWSSLGLAFMPSIDVVPRLELRLDPAAELVGWLSDKLHPLTDRRPKRPIFDNNQFREFAQTLTTKELIGSQEARSLLSHSDLIIYDKFIKQWKDNEWHIALSLENENHARVIGHSLFALIFAFFGAVVGKILGRPRRPEPTPTEV